MAQEPCHAPAHYLRLLKSHNPHLARPEQDRRCRLPSRKQADRADRGWAATDPDPRNRQKSTESQALRLEALDDGGDGGDGGDGAEVSRTASQASHKSGAFDSRIAAAVGLSELTATEQCPHCSRRFSREAAARHVPICAGLKSRPKPPKEHMVYFTDQLGRRQASPNGQGDTGFSVASYNTIGPDHEWFGLKAQKSRAVVLTLKYLELELWSSSGLWCSFCYVMAWKPLQTIALSWPQPELLRGVWSFWTF